jgi:hypothetical protein
MYHILGSCLSKRFGKNGTLFLPVDNLIYYMVSRLNGMVDCGDRHNDIYGSAMLLVEQVKVSKGSQLITCLLEGPSGRYCMVFCLNDFLMVAV